MSYAAMEACRIRTLTGCLSAAKTRVLELLLVLLLC